jgi:hypothetical protein
MSFVDPSASIETQRPNTGGDRGRELIAPERVRMIARCWVVVAVICYVVDLLRQTSDGLTNGHGRPFGDDFMNYWSGAWLALHGRAAEVYDWNAFHVFQQSVTGPHIQFYHYSYPPVLLMLTAPLALVAYVPALGLWLLSSWYAFYRALKLTAFDSALLLSLAAPAVFINAAGGQNGAWIAALFGGGLLLLDRRPLVSGILFGLLVFKPHLGVMIPVALLAGRRWRAFGSASVTVLALVAMSVALFGWDLWLAYFRHVSVLRQAILEDGSGVWHRMISVFVLARRLGLDVGWAYAVQLVAAITAAVFVARSWLRDDAPDIRNALMILGTCLATPYLQDYDVVVGAFVVVWLQAAGGRAGMTPRTIQIACAAILLLPLFNGSLSLMSGIAIGPLVIVPVFALVVTMAWRSANPA